MYSWVISSITHQAAQLKNSGYMVIHYNECDLDTNRLASYEKLLPVASHLKDDPDSN
uniref:Photolyase/cryptochrome alpha/beta domain-containing protein n=1 Tax=Heterorhabditis bacteriophora TaxID=37862 RepID=A0A1I7W6S0_HETBA